MMELLRATDRVHLQRGKAESWLSIDPRGRLALSANDFGVVTGLDETRLEPGGYSGLHSPEEAEIVTYVHKGVVAQEDSTGSWGILHAGQFQRMAIGSAVDYRETNTSRTVTAHIVRVSLRPLDAGLGGGHEQEHFATAARRNVLRPVATMDGRNESLRILQDVQIYSSVLEPGRHVVHELSPGRGAWLYVIQGEATVQDLVLTDGDSVGVTNEPFVSFTAQEQTEILLVDGPVPDRM